MPNLKRINGHTSVRKPILYLVREGRALATDCVNCEWMDEEGRPVWEQMDETRKLFGNDGSVNGNPVRRYMHVVISPDPRDAVSLDQIRELATRWVGECFEGHEAFIAYHNDNESKILHAHLIINNTDTSTGERMSLKTRGAGNRRLDDVLQRISREMGLRSFLAEHDEQTAVDAAGLYDGRGVPGRPRQAEPRGRGEEAISARDGYVWKDDIRDRVRAAILLSRTTDEFVWSCAAMGINVSVSASNRRKGEWVFELDGHPTWRVSGARLGGGTSRFMIERALADARTHARARPPEARARAIRDAVAGLGREGSRMRYLGTVRGNDVTARDVASMLELAIREDIRSFEDFEEVAKAAPASTKREAFAALRLARDLGCFPEKRGRADGTRAPIGRFTDEQRDANRRGEDKKGKERMGHVGTESADRGPETRRRDR